MKPFVRPSTWRQRGVVSLQFAMFAFGFFALAAVVIDVRMAFVAAQNAQVATDVSALEGMRYRDLYGPVDRRTRARETLRLVFDDDTNLANGDLLQLGAGPQISLVGGQAESNALALIQLNGVYKPFPELNLPNLQHGDLVAGDFDTNDTAHDEFTDYARSDFAPSGPGAASQAADSFLVRIRRTNNVLGLDTVAGVSAGGPTLPFLFGLGSMIHRAPGSSYNPRTDGMTFRATSIAGARRAVVISGPGPSAGHPALQRFVLLSPGGGSLWDSLAVNGSVVLTRNAAGTLSQGGTVWGRFGRPAGAPGGVLTTVGEQVVPLGGGIGVNTGLESFVPIVRSIGGVERVIGFGRVRVFNLGASGNIRVQKLRGILYGTGVSAIVPSGIRALANSPALQAAHADFTEPMLGPVLTR